MALEVVFSSNPIQERDAQLARHFEQVVTEALRSHEALADQGPVRVRFHLWEGDDEPRYVCKVECTGAARIDLEAPPWRWWSGLVETPHQLGQELREAVRGCGEEQRPAQDVRPAPAPVEHWGWAGELQLG